MFSQLLLCRWKISMLLIFIARVRMLNLNLLSGRLQQPAAGRGTGGGQQYKCEYSVASPGGRGVEWRQGGVDILSAPN